MRMSCGGWTGGSNPASSPRRNSLAYRRYLRFLPGHDLENELRDYLKEDTYDPHTGNAMGGSEMESHQLEEEALGAMRDGAVSPHRRNQNGRLVARQEREILRERGVNRWLRDQAESRAAEMNRFSANNDNESDENGDRKDADKDKVSDVSVSSLVRQYTAMLNARYNLAPNVLQTSRSCSSLHPKPLQQQQQQRHQQPRTCSGAPRRVLEELKNTRHGSLDSGDGDSSDSLLGPRYRSFSLPWPSEANWRWSSPNIMDGTQQASVVCEANPVQNINQHSSSLARLDSGTSDEGCPRDGSAGPTPPLSPVFRGLTTNHLSHLSGLITPFKALSPASSMGSHLGSVEDIPLARSMSLGHVLDHWIRSRSADSAVEVEDDSVLISPAASPAHLLINGDQEACKNEMVGEHVRVSVCISDDVDDNGGKVGDRACGVCDDSKHATNWCSEECRVNNMDEKLPNGEIACDDNETNRVFCECDDKTCVHQSDIKESLDAEAVELRPKMVAGTSFERRERRCGEVDGDILLRRARGCGGLAGTGVLQELSDEPCRKVLRTPSVVISDHSGDTISLTVALASSDFSIDKLDEKFQPNSVSPSSSSASLCVNDDASRKVSSCSSCSSVSTVDMTTPLTPMLVPNLDSLMEVPQRRISDCSTASNVTISEDEIEQILPRPPPPKKQSNWRKVRNIVQWTPFIQTYKKHKYPWVQLAGHQGNFRAGYKQGTILKKLCPAEEKALEAIMKDVLRPYVPLYMGVVEGTDSEKYLQLQDLLSDFEMPCVMDIKMGVRTYLEDELAKAREKPKLRKDMYEKMVQIDPKAPTEGEQRAKAVTKPRYMVWRETISSTATQGFRIEGVRRGDGTSSKDFKTTRTREQVLTALNSFLHGYSHAASRYVQQLKSIKVTLEGSPFFNSHELIGSSLLFVHNDTSATVRMIDFAKTIPLPENVHITHRSPWSEGTHEDGYLLGLDNLIDLFSVMEKNLSASESSKAALPNSVVSEQTISSSSNSSSSNSSSTQTTTTSNSASIDSSSSSSSSSNSTTTTITPLPAMNSHTALPVNASS